MNFNLITQNVRPHTCLDIGANVGHWFAEAKEAWRNCAFLLIEGNPACEEMLALSGAEYRIALLSDEEKIVDFWMQPGAPTGTGASIYRENTPFYFDAQPVQMQTKTLDKLLDGRTFDLLKLDCQGSELDILKGGPKTLAEADAVLMEVALTDYNEGAPQEFEVKAFMLDAGFPTMTEIERVCSPLTGEHVQSDILFTR